MKEYLIKAKQVFTQERFSENLWVRVRGERIVEVADLENAGDICDLEIHEYPDAKLVPGFIDIQVNGGGGILFNNQSEPEDFNTVIQAHRKFGTTGLMATLISDLPEKTERFVRNAEKAMEQGVEGLLGVHLEGPFLNRDFKGTHNPEYFVEPTAERLNDCRPLTNGLSMMTIAPEKFDGGQIQALIDKGFILMAGHSACAYNELKNLAPKGISGATHLFNAMAVMRGREPGIVGYTFDNEGFFSSVIFDGIHCHPTVIRILFSLKPLKGIIAVTDSMALIGSDRETFRLNGKKIRLSGGQLYDEEGILSGAHIGMSQSLDFLHRLGYPLETLIPLFTQNPARFLGIENRSGKISLGYQADLTLLDSENKVINTYIKGIPAHYPLSKSARPKAV